MLEGEVKVAPLRRAPRGTLVNDVHSRLNATRVRAIVRPESVAELCALVRRAAREGRTLSVAGGRHAMGGQAFLGGETLIDARGLDRVLAFDADGATIEAQAGICWPALMDATHALSPRERPLAVAQKQTGADDLTLGGSLAANAHGRGLALAPLAAQVEAFEIVTPEGEPVRASRTERPELFALAIGGYGMFGVITSVVLRLAPRQKLARRVRVIEADGLIEAFEQRVAAGFLYGDFQVAIDPASPDFLRRGVFSCYEPVDRSDAIPDQQRQLGREDWQRLLHLAHTRKSEAFERYAAHYLATDGQLYWSDTHQLSTYVDGYHAEVDRAGHPGSEMISELYVPRARFGAFMADLRGELARRRADTIYGTVRLIERDEDTYLAWARERWACLVLNLHVEHTAQGMAAARGHFRAMIDVALEHGGSFFLTYHRWATARQLRAAHPRIDGWLALKRRLDPDGRFGSDWYRALERTLAC